MAWLADKDPTARAKLNRDKQFCPLNSLVNANNKDKQYEEPWYLLYRMFVEHQKSKLVPDAKLIQVLLLTQAQRPALKHELLAEHQLCNMAASDYGHHSAMPHLQAAKFLSLVYEALLVTRHVHVSRLQLEGTRRV